MTSHEEKGAAARDDAWPTGVGAGASVPPGLGARLRERAREMGFDPVGIARPDPSEHAAFYRRWIEEGRHGEMGYLARSDALVRRAHVRASMKGARSVLIVGQPYYQEDPEGVPGAAERGVIARYARGRDYHRVLRKGLRRLHRWIEDELGRPVNGRAYVDTGPVLERELAQRAGLGWFGKNTMLIHPRKGSYFFLGALLLDLELEPDEPFEEDHCGTCRRCIEACPTGALLGRTAEGAPVMEARRCISYLTIEHRGPIPRHLRPLIGNRVYGCDICQEVCPFNVKFAEEAVEPGYAARGPGERPVGVEALPGEESGAAAEGDTSGEAADAFDQVPRVPAETSTEPNDQQAPDVSAETPLRVPLPVHPGTDGPPLPDLLATALSEERWESFSRGSAIRRAGRAGFARNVLVAVGNWLAEEERPDPVAVDLLVQALSDPEPLVRGHAAWALGRIRSPEAGAALAEAWASEEEPFVRDELEASLWRA